MHKALIFCSILFYSVLSLAQNKSVQVVVRDKISHETLIGVNISESNKPLGRTDVTGTCRLKLSLEKHQLSFSYTGYQTYQLEIDLLNHPIESLEILLEARSEALKQITVSGSRFEKRMAEEIVSIEVLKPAYVLQTANNQVDDALQRVAGVDVVENQVNIRGGSGWSYGAGSRVLVLVDDMPMLTADAGDAKWDFLPIENCEQIEVIKGASSCLYGSSALNGVINFRTGFARQKSKTKVMLYNGLYGNPPDKRWAWWGKQQPGFQGGYLMHAQKFGAWDMVLGSAWYNEDSYLQGDLNRRGRVNLNLRYRFPKVEGLIAGLNSNVQLNKSQTFFFWQPDSVNGTKYYQPFGGLADSSTTLNKNNGQRMNFDPYISYTGRRGAKHILRTRYFRSNNDIPEKQQSSKAITGYGEYQFQKRIQHTSPWLNELNLITGLSGSYSEVEGALFGNHQIMNMAPYLQAEKKFGKLWTSLGMRYELNQVDDYAMEKKPVFRAGVNYELSNATFLRASYGEGYRYPSIAERFVKTTFGASSVFPNPGLQSETGWSAEVGIRQGFRVGSWLGMIDLAAFWSQYYRMMEFNFGIHIPEDSTLGTVANPVQYLGFKSINVGDARINGFDLSVNGEGKFLTMKSRVMLGYTKMNPLLLNPDSAILSNISGPTHTLKYRYRHSLKLDWENTYHRISIGNTLLYNSSMQNIDEVFENTKPNENPYGVIFEIGTGIPSSVNAFRTKYNRGTLIWDLRVSVQLSQALKLAFITKNLLNTIYTERPAIMGAPRNFTLQLAAEL